MNRKHKKIIILANALLQEPEKDYSSEQFFEIAPRKKLEDDMLKLKNHLLDLQNRRADPSTRKFLIETKLKIKLLSKELDKHKTFTF